MRSLDKDQGNLEPPRICNNIHPGKPYCKAITFLSHYSLLLSFPLQSQILANIKVPFQFDMQDAMH